MHQTAERSRGRAQRAVLKFQRFKRATTQVYKGVSEISLIENDPLEDHNIAQNNLEQIDEFEKNILKLKNNSMSDKKLEELSPEELEETEKELKKMGYI